MAVKNDLVGRIFGKLKVISIAAPRETPSGRFVNHWNVQCECGNKKEVSGGNLTRKVKGVTSCGCSKGGNRSHLDSYTRLYQTHKDMKRRCNNPNAKNYHNYGGRGITICSDWQNSYLKFKSWAMSNGYTKDLTIDRVDNNGNYEPSNCRWATKLQQDRNRRQNHLVLEDIPTIKLLHKQGKTIADIAILYKVEYNVIWYVVRNKRWIAVNK